MPVSPRRVPLALALLAALPLLAVEYPLTPDSERQPGVPEGRVEHFEHTGKIFPGAEHGVWVYVPAQYDAAKPAALMVFQDGGRMHRSDGETGWRTTVVLDNLIHQGAMPVTIGVFADPGVMPALTPAQRERYNRSYEYDGLGDRYARLLIEEILPEVAKRYNLTADPNLRGIGGSSSGGIAAFTAAWERPDYFRRVLSFVGSYTNLRGGNIYPGLVRKIEPKPLRVFLQDGRHDLNIYSGSWWMSNQDLALALDYAGYDSKFVTGEEGHNNRHGRALLPEALRWLWRDWETPIRANRQDRGDRHWVLQFADPAADWELVSSGHTYTEGPAIAPNGDIYFSDVPESKIWRIDAKTQKASLFLDKTQGANGLMFGPDGRLYACKRDAKQVVAIDIRSKKEEVLTEGVEPNDLVVTARGEIYFTEPATKSVWHLGADRKRRAVVTEGVERPNGVMLSPDQSLLTVADTWNKWAWSYQIQPDGSLANGQPFYHLETGDTSSRSGADGMTMGVDGHLYVATALGVQICDQPGRVVGVLDKPHRGPLSNVVFAGPDLQTLYATAGDKVFRRRMRVKGVLPWQPVQPPVPGL